VAQEWGKQLEVRKNVQQLFEKVWSPSVSWSEKSNNEMTWDDAVTYCKNLGGRLPTIDELRTLIQNCPATETGGECGVTDECLSFDCQNDACDGCENAESVKNSKLGDTTEWFWSSSELSGDADLAWFVGFYRGGVYGGLKSNSRHVRCLR